MPADEDFRYCVLCESQMLFELVDADDQWICVRCGSAVFVDPPVQAARRSA